MARPTCDMEMLHPMPGTRQRAPCASVRLSGFVRRGCVALFSLPMETPRSLSLGFVCLYIFSLRTLLVFHPVSPSSRWFYIMYACMCVCRVRGWQTFSPCPPILPYRTLSCPTLPYPTLTTLPYPTLPYPTLPYLTSEAPKGSQHKNDLTLTFGTSERNK